MRRKFLKYNPRLKLVARKLRNNSTLSEIILWQQLKGKKIQGYDFHRQKPIDRFIVDFFCPRLMLAIEIDGSSHSESSHSEKMDEDEERQKRLESLGIRFLRFPDHAVKKDLQGVLTAIDGWIRKHKKSQVSTSPLARK